MRPCWCEESRKQGSSAEVSRFPYLVPPGAAKIGEIETWSVGYKCAHCGHLLEAPIGMWHVKHPNGSVDFERDGIKYAIDCVGPGWRWLIGRLWRDIRKMGWDGALMQVKEKFGGLRFYIGGATNEIHNRIEQAQVESYKICEHCGKPGSRRDGGWIKALCDDCHAGRPTYRWNTVDPVKKVQ